MAYMVEFGINEKEIYNKLTPAEKCRFKELVISDVKKNGDTVSIKAVAIENEYYNDDEYNRLLDEKKMYPIDSNGLIDGYKIVRSL